MPHVSNRSRFDLADKALDGTLATLLDTWRAEGAGYETISRRLERQGVVVSRETVRRWVKIAKETTP